MTDRQNEARVEEANVSDDQPSAVRPCSLTHDESREHMHVNVKLLVWQTVGMFMIFALALFLPAGTLAWLAGWIFLALFFGFYLAVTVWLFRHNPGLLKERMRFHTSDQQGWDKV